MTLTDHMRRVQIAHELPVMKEIPTYAQMTTDRMQQHMGEYADPSALDYQGLMSIVASIYTANRVIATSVAQLPKQILRFKKGKESENIIENPEFKVFLKPNEQHTAYDFWEQVMGYLGLVGESPWALGRTGAGKIDRFYPIRPDLIKIVPSNENLVDHYEFMRSGNIYRLEPEDIFFLKYFNPLNQLRGLSPLSAAKADVTLELQAITAGKETFKSGVRPSGVLSAEIDSETEWDRYRAHVEDEYSGAANFGKLLFLGRKMDYQQLSLSQEDMQYIQTRQMTKDIVMGIYGVPPIFFMQFKEASVLANADIQYRLLWETIKGILAKVEGIITVFLLPQITSELGLRFKFDLSGVAALQPDLDKLAKRFENGVKNAAATPNDFREHILKLEREDNPAMDLHYISGQMYPIDGTETEEESLPGKAGELVERARNLLSNDNIIEATFDIIKKVNQGQRDAELNALCIKSYGTIMRLANRLADRFAKKLRVFFNDQRIEVLRNLRSNKTFKFTSEGVMFDTEKWNAEFAGAGAVFIEQALKEAGADLGKEAGITWSPGHPNVGKYVNQRSIQYAKLVNKISRKAIDKIIKKALADGLSIPETAKLLEQYFKSQGPMRAMRIARTEMVSSVNNGRMQVLKQNKWRNMWATQRDERVRDSHASADGEVVDAGEPFQQLGAGYGGDPVFPSDIFERCYVVPMKPKKKG